MKLPFRSPSLLAALVVGGGLFLTALPSRAQLVAFNNFGPGDSIVDESGGASGMWIGGPDSAVGGGTVGFQFTAASGGVLNSVVTSVGGADWWYPGTPSAITMTLTTDSNGIPGSVLESWTTTDLPGWVGAPTTFASVNFPTLVAGDSYFLVGSGVVHRSRSGA